MRNIADLTESIKESIREEKDRKLPTATPAYFRIAAACFYILAYISSIGVATVACLRFSYEPQVLYRHWNIWAILLLCSNTAAITGAIYVAAMFVRSDVKIKPFSFYSALIIVIVIIGALSTSISYRPPEPPPAFDLPQEHLSKLTGTLSIGYSGFLTAKLHNETPFKILAITIRLQVFDREINGSDTLKIDRQYTLSTPSYNGDPLSDSDYSAASNVDIGPGQRFEWYILSAKAKAVDH